MRNHFKIFSKNSFFNYIYGIWNTKIYENIKKTKNVIVIIVKNKLLLVGKKNFLVIFKG